MQTQLNFLQDILPKAGAVCLPYFRQQFKGIGGTIKSDASPVTRADQETEEFIRLAIAKIFPKDGIFGEEQARVSSRSGGTWIIDPIDGTKSFISHNPMFAVLLGYHVAVQNEAEMRIGGAYLPALEQLWYAEATGKAYCNGQAMQTSDCRQLADALFSTTSPDLFDKTGFERFGRLSQQCRYRLFGGDATQYLAIASGGLDVVFEMGLKPYDYLPLVPIIESAGGMMTDAQGNRLGLDSDGSVLATAHPKLHQAALSVLNI